MNERERFDAKTDKSGECWLWTGATLANGYGQSSHMGRVEGAHRVAVLLDGRDIPEGMQVDHLCRTRNCVRPDHLEVVTPRVNTLRGDTITARNATKTHCIRGHALDGENVRVKAGKWRECRACQRIHLATYRSKNPRGAV